MTTGVAKEHAAARAGAGQVREMPWAATGAESLRHGRAERRGIDGQATARGRWPEGRGEEPRLAGRCGRPRLGGVGVLGTTVPWSMRPMPQRAMSPRIKHSREQGTIEDDNW